jgi:polyhydroxybutyrate depolymerase
MAAVLVPILVVLVTAAACSSGSSSSATPTAAHTTTTSSFVSRVGTKGCNSTGTPPAGTQTLRFDGLTRTYIVHLPPTYDSRRPTPFIFNLHGFGGNAKQQDQISDLPAQAGKRGYVVVTPQGAPISIPSSGNAQVAQAKQYSGFAFWNFFGSSGAAAFGPNASIPLDVSKLGTDDVGFLSSLLGRMSASLCLDTRRIYSTGLSNGAGMSTTLACEIGDRIAAIAPVSGVNLSGACPEKARVSVLAIHGDADTVAAYTGNSLMGYKLGNPSVPARMTAWAAQDGCNTQPAVDQIAPKVTVSEWRLCKGDTEVQLWTIHGGQHEWPRGKTAAMNATKTILDFFDAHQKAGS